MNRQQFSRALARRLSNLPRGEIRERLAFYNEMIDDRMEEGLSEEEAVRAIGSIDALAPVSDATSESKRACVKEKRLSASEIVWMVIGAPIWLPLFLVALAVIGAVYAVLWSLVLAVWAIEAPFFVMGFVSKYLFVFCKNATICSANFTKYSASRLSRAFQAIFGGPTK